jgi:hypothetical protein
MEHLSTLSSEYPAGPKVHPSLKNLAETTCSHHRSFRIPNKLGQVKQNIWMWRGSGSWKQFPISASSLWHKNAGLEPTNPAISI